MSIIDTIRHHLSRRPPDVVIGGHQRPYLLRWHVIPRNRRFNVYLHRFMRSDDDRALHDHPWWNVSILLRGRYLEHTPGSVVERRAGRLSGFAARRAEAAHRIELIDGPVWTLFVTGPRVREWGFWCPQGWRHWKIFTSEHDSGEVGRGCD
ncbi:MAG: hypothetical protein KDH20_01580 [Rhodocyclaceae bacterium]|nr:hypothetical protein [Rhodocyclaceae bacterium]